MKRNQTSILTSQGALPDRREFNPSRLQLARKRRGHNQTSLASLLGVDRRTIVAYEAGEFEPSGEILEEIAGRLDFPVSFFSGHDIEVPSVDAVSFRALSKMKAAQRDMAISQGSIAIELSNWLDSRFNLPAPDLPDLSSEEDPESAAIALRYAWGRGEGPIKNIIHLMESKGVRVFSLSIDSREVDAYSMWRDSTPYVFLNTQKSSERSRFDAAHELGHLVMHRHSSPSGRQAEREANNFASAFLMPEKSVVAHAPSIPTLSALIKLKGVWNVSVAALAYRLHAIGLISDWTYRSLFAEINRRGFMRSEPEPSPRETSLVMTKALDSLRNEGTSRATLADKLSITERELDELTFGLVATAIRGGEEAGPSGDARKPQLRLIK